ncbi:uncharacterized protein LOC143444123 [Clavelina lepadiformis]|uniref:Uncharacterized protein n=1 Tax=Clavelina lepadiformis TaxID=159417 RepID=A0ABP0FXW6_CLALP
MRIALLLALVFLQCYSAHAWGWFCYSYWVPCSTYYSWTNNFSHRSSSARSLVSVTSSRTCSLYTKMKRLESTYSSQKSTVLSNTRAINLARSDLNAAKNDWESVNSRMSDLNAKANIWAKVKPCVISDDMYKCIVAQYQ